MTDFSDLLVKTSRTFALSIPALGPPLDHEVTISYLLFRLADTFEDAYVWPVARRAAALRELAELVRDSAPARVEPAARRFVEARPTEHAGYLELLGEMPAVMAAYAGLDGDARHIVAHHVARTCSGMAQIVERADEGGRLVLVDLADLRSYCYVVAGIVGELLTDLFLLRDPDLAPVRHELEQRAPTFGEALQLVNILKDADADAQEGRTFLPADVPRAEVIALARRDLLAAEDYVGLLDRHARVRGPVEFAALPVLLAWAALDEVASRGSGAKVARATVAESVMALKVRLASGEPAIVRRAR